MKLDEMKYLYHGTDSEFEKFDFTYAGAYKDFGKGFYLTSNVSQAQKWAQNKAGRRKRPRAYIYQYKVNKTQKMHWKILELLRYDKEWLDFIVDCRINGQDTDYDVIYDRMADNRYKKLSELLMLYADNQMPIEAVLREIKWEDMKTDQYCFKNEKALEMLRRKRIIVQEKDEDGRWRIIEQYDQ